MSKPPGRQQGSVTNLGQHWNTTATILTKFSLYSDSKFPWDKQEKVMRSVDRNKGKNTLFAS